jgi:hypothetical protein
MEDKRDYRIIKHGVVRVFPKGSDDSDGTVFLQIVPPNPNEEAINEYRRARRAAKKTKTRDKKVSATQIAAPNSRPRGKPADDEILLRIKAAIAFYAYEMNAAIDTFNEIYNRGRHAKKFYSFQDIWAEFRLPYIEPRGLLQFGAKCAQDRMSACDPGLKNRFPTKLFEQCLKAENWEFPQAIIAERADVLNLLVHARSAYEYQASGLRKIEHEIRRGRIPKSETVTKIAMNKNEYHNLSFVEKIRVALYAWVNPSDIWLGPELRHDDHITLPELFVVATAVGRLAAGQAFLMPRRLALALTTGLRQLMDAETEFGEHDQFPELWQGMRSVNIMLQLVFDKHSAQLLELMLQSGAEEIPLVPKTPAGCRQMPLSSLMVAVKS